MVRVQRGTFSYSQLELQDGTVFMNFCWLLCFDFDGVVVVIISMGNARERVLGLKFNN